MEYEIIRNRAKPVNTIVSILAIPISTFGILLGLSLIYILAKKQWSKLYIDLKLVFITISIDLLVSSWSIICSILDLTDHIYFISSQFGCNISAAISILLCLGSINCVAVTAIERYTVVYLHRSIYVGVYYIFLFGFFAFNVLGCLITIYLNGFSVHPTSIYCSLNFKSFAGRVGMGFLGFSEILSLAIVYSVYLAIIIKRRNTALEIEQNFPLQPEEVRKKANSTIFKSGLIIVGSTFSNAPYCIITLISLKHPEIYTPLFDGIVCLCMITNAIFNSLLILGMRPDLTEELRYLFKKILHKFY